VKHNEQVYELESPYFEKACEIHAFCGVSVLIRKDIFEKLGGFDESFFMYYEDTDLSLRMRKMGYLIYYEPNSIVYHLHSGSSVEWSEFFSYYAERNHLAFVIKHFRWLVVFRRSALQLAWLFLALLYMIWYGIKANWAKYEKWEERFEYRKRVVLWIMHNMGQLIKKRQEISHTQKISMESIFATLY
jgi:GT2 family glycosyltransferase